MKSDSWPAGRSGTGLASKSTITVYGNEKVRFSRYSSIGALVYYVSRTCFDSIGFFSSFAGNSTFENLRLLNLGTRLYSSLLAGYCLGAYWPRIASLKLRTFRSVTCYGFMTSCGVSTRPFGKPTCDLLMPNT